MTEFRKWPKTIRPKANTIIITEKMDGTNACVVVENSEVVAVQSRNRFIKIGDDNMGFAVWVEQNKDELVKLGDGYHFGEWVGEGIQKNPHNLTGKHFYLFNTRRPSDTLPDCVKQVPILYHGEYDVAEIDRVYTELWQRATGGEEPYMPEGLIVHFLASDHRVKYTYTNQDGKWVK